MEKHLFWQNFQLGTEIDIAAGFLYDGIRNLDELSDFRFEADIFPIMYNFSVGLERLLKVAVVLLEFDGTDDTFEKRLITHDHMDLINRIKKFSRLSLGSVHNEFLSLLAKFYKTYRYDRFSADSVSEISKEKVALLQFLSKHTDVDIEEDLPLKFLRNSAKIKKYIGNVLKKISNSIYQIIINASRAKGLYTFEVRYDSKAGKLFLAERFDFINESVLWKELLIFFLHLGAERGARRRIPWLKFLSGIEPLSFDPALMNDYLSSFNSNRKNMEILDELDELYLGVENVSVRLDAIHAIGDPGVHLDLSDS